MKTTGSAISIGFLRSSSGLFLRTFLLISFAFLLLGNNALQAAYLKNVPQTLTQPDGSTFKCFATGDEYYNWLHDASNFTIIQDAVTGFYVYAVKSGDKLVASSLIAGKSNPASAGLQPGINISPEQVVRLSKELFRIPALKGGSTTTTTGTLNNIVIFIRFNDQGEFSEPVTKYTSAFNATGSPSMVEYFKEVSGSQLTINTSFFPQTGGTTVVSYQNSRNRNYYCKYNAVTNTEGYQDDNQRSDREMNLVKEATESVRSQIESTGLDYDNDNNGMIDNVCYIVQGDTDGWSELLWPHMWALYAYNVTIGGAKVWDFNFQIASVFGVHVLCHEMSHSLGFPDLYRYADRSINPVGPWDVMSSITNPPQHQTVYTKVKYGKWASSIPEISTGGTYTLNPLATDPLAAYKIASPNSTSEYFVVEYRKTTGQFEAQLLGSGLIVYRVSPSLNGNSYGPPDEVYMCRPNGTVTQDGDLADAFYSSNSGRTSVGGSSSTQLFLSNGAPGGFQITNIGTAGESISFTVSFGNAPAVLAVTPTSKELAVNGGSATFAVSNAGAGTMTWNAAVTSGNSWAHITSGSTGSNSGNIALTADSNPESSTRTAVITVTAPGVSGGTKTITMVQAANNAVLEVTPASRNLEFTGGSASFSVSNTGGGTMRWTAAVTSGGSWANITSDASGSNTGSIQVNVEANNDRNTRTATITLTATDAAGSPKILTIVQAANNTMLNAGPEIQSVSYGSTTTSFAVSNTGGGIMSWSAAVTSGDNWAHIISGSGGSNSGTISVLVDANPEMTARSAAITITAADAAGSPKTVTITQAANETILNAGPASQNVTFGGSVTTFAVSNIGAGTIEWTASVTTGSSWAHITGGDQGTNSGTISVTIDANPDNSPRSASITVTDASGINSPEVLVVNQEANLPVLAVSPGLQDADFRRNTITLAVANTGGGLLSWNAEITGGDDWATITNGSNGTNTGTITLELEANPGSIRTATITVTANGSAVRQLTATIVQAAKEAELEVDPDIQTIEYRGGLVNFGVSKSGTGTINWSAELSGEPAWARIVAGVEGSNDGQIAVEVDPNGGAPRTARIIVTSNDPSVSQKILTINQDISNSINTIETAGNLKVYPNPVVNQCTVQLEEFNGTTKKLEVFNMMGQMESSQQLDQERTNIDLSNLPQGIYLFRVLSENNILSQKRVVKN